MTKEEAIEKLKLYDNYFYGIWGKDKCRNVFDVAIEALQAETKHEPLRRVEISGEKIVEITSEDWEIIRYEYMPFAAQCGEDIDGLQLIIQKTTKRSKE